jgi:trehalose 6-phosphate phosphatase
MKIGGISFDLRQDAFFFDFDGTLADIAARPADVALPARTIDELARLNDAAGGALAVVSGRTIAFLDAILSPLAFAAAGVHGLELRTHPHASLETHAPSAALEDVLPQVAAFAAAHDGILVENKGLAVALHVRQRPEFEGAAVAFLAALAAAAPAELEVQRGKCVAELRVAGPDKGQAVRRLMTGQAFAGRRPVYFGDDITDEPAFVAAQGLGGIGVAVGPPGRLSAARDAIGSPAEVRRLVARLASGRFGLDGVGADSSAERAPCR